MKRILLLMSCALLLSTAAFAQKANVSKAKNKAFATENPDYNGAKVLIEEALVNEQTKGLANTWFVAGEVYEKSATNGRVEKDALKSYDYFLKAYELDQLPDAKGKVKPKLVKKVADNMFKLYYSNQLLNYAISKFNNHEYKDAGLAFEKHMSIPDLVFASEYKTPIVKDSIFYQVAYYAASSAHLNGDTVLAVKMYEENKNKGYEENRINQLLAEIYKNQKDTAKFISTLEYGINHFPQEFYFLGSMINHYVYSGQTAQAINFLDEAIARDPNNVQYYVVKSGLYEELKDLDNSMLMIDKAIELNASSADAWYNKGRLIFNKGVAMESEAISAKDMKVYDAKTKEAKEIFKQAMPYFEKAIELDNKNEDYLRQLRQLYFRFQDDDKAYEKKYNEITELINNL